MKKTLNHYGLKLMIVIFVGSCIGVNRNEPVTSAEPETKPLVIEPASANRFNITDHNSNSLGEINLDNPVFIRWGENILYRVIREEKSKYRNDNDENVYEIKFGEDGFKLRDGNGNMLWKLKNRDGKLKISSNEEMQNAYEIKNKGTLTEVTMNEKMLGSLDFGSASVPMSIKSGSNSCYITGPNKNMTFAILGIPEIPNDQQLILICEVLLSTTNQ